MRVLLTWELALNLGHLTRLLPIAQQLKSDGHIVLVAARDMQAAATVLGPAGISFIQAPHLPQGIPLAHRATGYADILLSQGWSDQSALWGLTQGWLNLFQLFRPDKLILDYSPTVSLAARAANLDSLLVRNGFELPPLTDPLPPFPGFSWATAEKAAESEAICVAHASGVLNAFKAPGIAALRDLTSSQTRMFATLPALDHYGAREGGDYIGPLLGSVSGPRVDWPSGQGPKSFVSLRRDSRHADEILEALATMTARVICVASGFARSRLEPLSRSHIVFSLGPVDLQPLLDANLCITYGAEGTMMRFLLAGVPQLVSPWHVETYMAARMLRTHGFGASLEGTPTRAPVAEIIERYANDAETRFKVQSFAASSKEVAIHKGVSHIVRHVNRSLDVAVLPDVSALPTGARRSNSDSRGGSRPGAIVLAILATAANLTSCGSDTQNPQLANGWVTSCSGPEFSKFSQNSRAGPGPARPVFRINDQLVLAVPKNNGPSSGRIESEPRECRTISDLPKVPYLYFVIQGNWSGGYKPEDVRLDGGSKRFLPDAVTVRIEREPPSTLSIDEQRKVERIVSKFWNDLLDKQEIGGLMCGKYIIPRYPSMGGGLFCSGHRTPSDPDTIKFSTQAYDITPFLLIHADYPSSHYGGIHVYWQVWTSDVSHGLDIDRAIWNSLTDWNLIDKNDTAFSPKVGL